MIRTINAYRPYEEKVFKPGELATMAVKIFRIKPTDLQIIRAQRLAKDPLIVNALHWLDSITLVEIKNGRSKFWEVLKEDNHGAN